ncbi:MAG TPA: recombination-associated protein RdgC [Desulfosalsimonadaceae bacterium]|nr:recombination-associated protein RdgC [Desulfosalsimonadaceae bacterium]
MGLLSATLSFARYQVEGEISGPFLESVREGLKNNMIREIDNDPAEKSVGWTSLDSPFQPDFDRAELVFGTRLIFCLRIDKKQIPAKVMNKHLNAAVARRLSQSNRSSLTRNEKQELRDEVARRLYLRIPATPGIFEVVWNYEQGVLWFFSTQKAANEELETVFSRSFKLSIIRMFPYTEADLACGLSDEQKDRLYKLTPSDFEGGAHA